MRTNPLLTCLVGLLLLSASSSAAEPAGRRTGKYPLIAGVWQEWDGIFVNIAQHHEKFVATCTYRNDDNVEVHWRAEGTISEDGDITASLVHTRPDGYKSQTRTAKLDPDGKTIRGHAAWDDGGHDFTWTLKEPSGASRSLDRHAFVPPHGKCLLLVGQDNQSIDDYVAATGVVPGGVMVYTGVHDFGNVADFDYLLKKYPRCASRSGSTWWTRWIGSSTASATTTSGGWASGSSPRTARSTSGSATSSTSRRTSTSRASTSTPTGMSTTSSTTKG